MAHLASSRQAVGLEPHRMEVDREHEAAPWEVDYSGSSHSVLD